MVSRVPLRQSRQLVHARANALAASRGAVGGGYHVPRHDSEQVWGHKMRRWKAMIVIWQLVSVIMTASFWEVCCLACSRASVGFFWAVGAELEYAYAPRTCTIGCLGHRRPECWERVPVDAQIDATDVLTFFSVA